MVISERRNFSKKYMTVGMILINLQWPISLHLPLFINLRSIFFNLSFMDNRGVILALDFPKDGEGLLAPHLIVRYNRSILGIVMISIQNLY